jgi:hypothetical protein
MINDSSAGRNPTRVVVQTEEEGRAVYHKMNTLLFVTNWRYQDKVKFTVNVICGVSCEICS